MSTQHWVQPHDSILGVEQVYRWNARNVTGSRPIRQQRCGNAAISVADSSKQRIIASSILLRIRGDTAVWEAVAFRMNQGFSDT